ncbi:MAG: deoxyribonuclease IV [Calditrichia bacterium]
MASPPLGAHTSTAGGLFNALYEGKEIKADVVQIFSKNQRQWFGKGYSEEDLEKFFGSREETGVQPVMIHTSYLINLASTNMDTLKKSIAALKDEIERAHTLKIPYVVQHPGSHMGEGEEAGLQKIADNLKKVIVEAAVDDVLVLLETTAGQGTNLGYTFEQIKKIIDLSGVPDHLGVCMDTCHIFAAGYDIRTADGWDNTKNKFDEIIGLEKLMGFHLNDSMKEFGSRKDRHERIGKGELGLAPFEIILNDPRLREIPMVLEVPGGKEAYAEDLVVLRGLIK